MHYFLSDNNLLSPNQLRFRSVDSWINQLLSIYHEISNAFDKVLEVRGIFLDISKVFDNVWHDGLIFKLHQNGISRDIINILRDFLRNRKQQVVLYGQCLSWADVILMFLKDQSLDLWCSWYILMVYLMVLKVNVNYLLMTLLCFRWFMILILQQVILMRTWENE